MKLLNVPMEYDRLSNIIEKIIEFEQIVSKVVYVHIDIYTYASQKST